MKNKVKIIKRKFTKTWLNKTLNRIILPVYCTIMLALIAAALILNNDDSLIADILSVVCIALVLIRAVAYIFFVVPACRGKQAVRDLKNHDFTPYDSVKDEEKFTFEKADAKYFFTPSPFADEEGVSVLTGEKQLDAYLEQFAVGTLKRVELLGETGDFIPFSTFDFGRERSTAIADKRIEGEFITVKITHKYELFFAADGVHFYDEVIPYDEINAYVHAKFILRESRSVVGLSLVLGDTALAFFAFGTRIMRIVERYGIKIENRELADFIMLDPERAFYLVGKKKNLDKLKPARLKAELEKAKARKDKEQI